MVLYVRIWLCYNGCVIFRVGCAFGRGRGRQQRSAESHASYRWLTGSRAWERPKPIPVDIAIRRMCFELVPADTTSPLTLSRPMIFFILLFEALSVYSNGFKVNSYARPSRDSALAWQW